MGGARVILSTAPNSRAITELIDGLGRGGQIIMVSAPEKMMQFHPMLLLRAGRSIAGWVGGDIGEAIDFSLLTHVVFSGLPVQNQLPGRSPGSLSSSIFA